MGLEYSLIVREINVNHGKVSNIFGPYFLAIFLPSMQQKWDQGTLGKQSQPSLGLGPALDFQGTLPWPYNTSDMALYI